MIRITQGDTPVLTITCQQGQGRAFDISAGSFQTLISATTGGYVTLPNAKHTIVTASDGIFTLALAASDSAAFAIGTHEIVTKVTQGGTITTFHGVGAIEVLPATPRQ